MNESQAITNSVTKSSDHLDSIPDTQFPIMPFRAKLFPDDCCCLQSAFKYLISGVTRGPTMLQEANQAPWTHGEVGHPGALRRHMYNRHRRLIRT
jgi:hypothetical protein